MPERPPVVRRRLQAACDDYLSIETPDVVPFVDELIDVAVATGEVRCSVLNRQTLLFELPHGIYVAWRGDIYQLRRICPRLAVLCLEPANLYGGEGTLVGRDGTRCSMRMMNAPGRVWFVLSRLD